MRIFALYGRLRIDPHYHGSIKQLSEPWEHHKGSESRLLFGANLAALMLQFEPDQGVEVSSIEYDEVDVRIDRGQDFVHHCGRGPRVEEKMPLHRQRTIRSALGQQMNSIPAFLEERFQRGDGGRFSRFRRASHLQH